MYATTNMPDMTESALINKFSPQLESRFRQMFNLVRFDGPDFRKLN